MSANAIETLRALPLVGATNAKADWVDRNRAAVETLLEAAREPVDIGDQVNRCRICWVAWGAHEEDCAVRRVESGQ